MTKEEKKREKEMRELTRYKPLERQFEEQITQFALLFLAALALMIACGIYSHIQQH